LSRRLAVVLAVAAALSFALLAQLATAAMLRADRTLGISSGSGSVILERPPPRKTLPRRAAVPGSFEQWTTVLSADFESASWPSGSRWQVFDDSGAEAGEYFWANRCSGHESARSAWAFGGGANGRSLGKRASYPALAESWMVAGPCDLAWAPSPGRALTPSAGRHERVPLGWMPARDEPRGGRRRPGL
jgi:hypothetical protein